MEAKYNKLELKFKDMRLALIFMGILMLVISSFLPSETNGDIKETLKILGIFFILICFVIVVFPHIMTGMGKINI